MNSQVISHRITQGEGFWDGIDSLTLPPRMRDQLPLRYLDAARKELKVHFLVEEISLRDGIELRDCLKQAVCLFIANQKLIDAGEVKRSRQINVYRESVILWLGRVYEPGIYEHPIVDIFLGGKYYGKNIEVWEDFVRGLHAALCSRSEIDNSVEDHSNVRPLRKC